MTFDEGRRLVFVGGAPRSGTTLVQNHLDAHPAVAGGPEYDNVPRVVELLRTLRRSVDSGRTSAFHPTEAVDREVGYLLERLLLPFADRRGAQLLSEKTPWNVLVFGDLLRVLPKARFVFVVRDPRAVVSSMLRVGERASAAGRRTPAFTRWVGSAVRCVARCNEAGMRAARASERVHVVRYERLVREPEAVTRGLCGFLGLGWDEAMARPGRVARAAVGQVDDVWYTREMYEADSDPSRVEAWRSHLTARQQRMVEVAFRGDRELAALGYELSRGTWADRVAGSVDLGVSSAGGFLEVPAALRARARRFVRERHGGGAADLEP